MLYFIVGFVSGMFGYQRIFLNVCHALPLSVWHCLKGRLLPIGVLYTLLHTLLWSIGYLLVVALVSRLLLGPGSSLFNAPEFMNGVYAGGGLLMLAFMTYAGRMKLLSPMNCLFLKHMRQPLPAAHLMGAHTKWLARTVAAVQLIPSDEISDWEQKSKIDLLEAVFGYYGLHYDDDIVHAILARMPGPGMPFDAMSFHDFADRLNHFFLHCFKNQVAFTKPSMKTLHRALGASIPKAKLDEYLNSYRVVPQTLDILVAPWLVNKDINIHVALP